MMNDDMDLLRDYAARQSDQAFATLVARHVHLVHSAALRQVRDPHLAGEITQTVFIILARKADSRGPNTNLSGSPYRTAQFVTKAALKREFRRRLREQEAHMQAITDPDQTDSTWEQLSPFLDEAMAQLRDKDRDAIVLRYFENRSLKEIGGALGVEERAAQKRVARGLEKLRKFFVKRGIASTTATLAGAISANSVQAAPIELAKTISAVAIAKGAAASTSTLTLIKGALKIMAWTKAKSVIVASAVVLLVAGTATVVVKEIQEHKTYSWQVSGFDGRRLRQASPQVAILSSKVPIGGSWGTSDDKVMGTGILAKDVVAIAFDPKNIFSASTRMIVSADLPQGRYDFIASLASGNAEALQKEVKRKFGIVAKRETRETDVLLLTIKYPNVKKLRPSAAQSDETSSTDEAGKFYCSNDRIGSLAYFLEDYFKTPVLDRTGLTNRFDIDLTWGETDRQHRNPEALKKALIEQLGLELVPTNMPIEMLVVEKAP